jgi:hypothetical protein
MLLRNWFIAFIYFVLFGCKPDLFLAENADTKVGTIISDQVGVKNGWYVSENYHVKFHQDSIFIQGFDFSLGNAEKNFSDEEYLFVNLDTIYKINSKEYLSWEDAALRFRQLYSNHDKGSVMLIFEKLDASETNAYSFFKKLKDVQDTIGDIIYFKVVSEDYLPAPPIK